MWSMEYYSALKKKEENVTPAMSGLNIMLNEICQSQQTSIV